MAIAIREIPVLTGQIQRILGIELKIEEWQDLWDGVSQIQKRKIMANKETEQPIFVNRDLSIPSAEYKKWIGELTKRYKQSQVKAAIKVNEGMLRFYWSLGRDIMLMKAEAKWGTSVLKNLSLDLQHEFPHSRGLSYTNLKYARQWYAFYNSSQVNRQQLVGEL